MTATLDYAAYLDRKAHEGAEHGFEPTFMPDKLFGFQAALVDWSVRKGRAAIFADCGLGKTFMQLVWAENVARQTGGRVLILAPLAVAFQTMTEGEKVGVEVVHRRTGIEPGDRIVVTNYERLHYFDPTDFQGVVCDESSILKGFDGATRAAITDFMRKRPYRLLCTATAAPNDYIELGTSSEALGELGVADMLSRFFTKADRAYLHSRGRSLRDERRPGEWRLRGHAETAFWRWVCSWARALRFPSDLGFEEGGFTLPPLDVRQHVVAPRSVMPGYLFDVAAVGLDEQRADLRRTIDERCEMAAALINAHDMPAIVWCNLNDESTALARRILGAVEVTGSDSEENTEQALRRFIAGEARVLVTKPTIAGFGLNFQHVAHVVMFPSHSYEQYYQAVRRCWRFGQSRPVVVDVVTTESQADVLANLQRKDKAATDMFEQLVAHMRDELSVRRVNDYTKHVEGPSWL